MAECFGVVVEEADTATALDIALDQLHEAVFELKSAHPDLGHVRMFIETACVFLAGAAAHG